MKTKIYDKKEFSRMIEESAAEKGCSYMDAIVDFCEKNEMEIEIAAKLLNPKIKKTIEGEALDVNMLKEKRGRLDI